MLSGGRVEFDSVCIPGFPPTLPLHSCCSPAPVLNYVGFPRAGFPRAASFETPPGGWLGGGGGCSTSPLKGLCGNSCTSLSYKGWAGSKLCCGFCLPPSPPPHARHGWGCGGERFWLGPSPSLPFPMTLQHSHPGLTQEMPPHCRPHTPRGGVVSLLQAPDGPSPKLSLLLDPHSPLPCVIPPFPVLVSLPSCAEGAYRILEGGGDAAGIPPAAVPWQLLYMWLGLVPRAWTVRQELLPTPPPALLQL